MKRVLAILAIVAMISGCAGIKKFICPLDVAGTTANVSNDINYINSRYNFYVTLLKGGNEQARPWVVAADLALAQLVPILSGLQKGVCYPQSQINAGVNMAVEAQALDRL
jgi:hypothetical protein